METLLHKLYQLHQYLGVGAALEVKAFTRQVFLDVGVVFYNAVMHQSQTATL